MSTEEKARAYDEALEKAKIEIDTKGIGETVNLCYQLFPQLAENDDEESEDERIINQLITLVNSAGEVLLIPTNKEELVAWLNKYKESLHIPETCKETANSFTEDERIRQWLYDLVDEGAYLCERPFATESILAYLEKQKEKLGDMSTILLVKKEIERRIETWQKSRKELIAMECNTLADDAAVRIEELYSLISFLGTIRCNTNEKQKEHKPQTDDEKEYVRTIKSIISDFIRDKKPENLAYYQRIYDWLDGRHVPISCGHENGKPLDNWKPSEEQMEALKRASVNEYIPAKQFDILVSLYKQLKKLM